MVNVTHDSNNWRTRLEFFIIIFIIFVFFHLHLLFHIDELNGESEFAADRTAFAFC